ncbi:MAG: nodulation protein NfeD [Chloroflexi bacterium]|nr:nodulation protein NfeD [Chloroflexota bacterium]
MVRHAFRLISALVIALALAGMAAAKDATVLVGRIEGVINPITARYVDRLITEGEQTGVRAVVFEINTPGGTLDATSQITTRMLNARVPVITFVAPSGARAASAGTFITLAGHVAAMAPATNLGAARPVDSSGGDIQGDLRQKVENDAVAQIRNIAGARSKNADWAEDAVRKSASIGADEAVSLKVVDLIATDLADLLAKLDGRSVLLPQGASRLATGGVAVDEQPFGPLERFLHFITDPQVAILLFTIGTYGLIFELSNPSLIFPGVVGVIAILLALFAFGTLDASSAGVALLIFATLLLVAEIWVPSHGILTAGGIAALVIGAIILFPPGRPTLPGFDLAIPPLTIALLAGGSALFFVALARASAGYLRLPLASGESLLVGAVGVARSDIDAGGIVHVRGEDWSARSEGGPIRQGEPVSVRAVDGLRLVVTRAAQGKEGV